MSSRLFMVHGFDYDPKVPKYNACAADGAFSIWAQHLPPEDFLKFPFDWYSGRAIFDLFKAWRHGHLTTYAWSYTELAVTAGERLARFGFGRGSDVICHSLGSRVVLQALHVKPNLFRRVIFLNGAETVKAAGPIIKRSPETQFLNISVSTDVVLKRGGAWLEPEWGKHHCIGYAGLKDQGLDNVIDIQLDNQTDKQFLKNKYGWDVAGDDPELISDHQYSYQHPGNWDLYRHFLKFGDV